MLRGTQGPEVGSLARYGFVHFSIHGPTKPFNIGIAMKGSFLVSMTFEMNLSSSSRISNFVSSTPPVQIILIYLQSQVG
jgi:hypothetical protein